LSSLNGKNSAPVNMEWITRTCPDSEPEPFALLEGKRSEEKEEGMTLYRLNPVTVFP